jgi:ATP-dependent Clp protease protease subunit
MSKIINLAAYNMRENPSFWLEGMVDDSMLSFVYNAFQQVGFEKPVNIFLNSPGGDLACALSIYDMIQNHNSDTNIIVMGAANSAATVILQAASKRFISKHSHVMIHAGTRVEAEEISASERKAWSRVADFYGEKMVEIYSKCMKKSKVEVKKLLKTDKIYIGSEAVAVGLVDEVWGG